MTDEFYQLTELEPADSPVPGDAGKWFRYVIEGAYAPIIGQQKGSRAAVKKHAEALAAELNERRRRGGALGPARRTKKAS
ncbi:MAG: hypothetical protein H6978_02860 [Gammaproteobacteria bacterium]|nr:hypothetical protein [Gammaproteobacteria bacterium]